jgi:predicted TIM-barrel fold metal-dependent hydrolase
MLSDETGESTLRVMDKVGIDRKVILIIDWGIGLGDPVKSIRDIHQEILGICSRFPDRLVGFAGVDPRRRDAAALIEWAFDTLGARGLKLHPTTGWSLADEATHHVVTLAAVRRLPVLVHIGKTLDILTDEHCQPATLAELAGAFPDTNFIAGHSGFDAWRVFAKQPSLPPNVLFDISGWQELDARDPMQMRRDLTSLLAAFPGRVAFGTDSPFFSYNLPAAESRWLASVLDVVEGLESAASVLCCPLFLG